MKLQSRAWYENTEFYLLCYPTQERAAAGVEAGAWAGWGGSAWEEAAYWSKQLNCNVTYVPINTMFWVLKVEGIYAEILCHETGHGWIYAPNWLMETTKLVKEE